MGKGKLRAVGLKEAYSFDLLIFLVKSAFETLEFQIRHL